MLLNDAIMKFSGKKEKAVYLLAAGSGATEAATACGVSRITVQRWQRDPLFKEALKSKVSELSERISKRILILADQALTELESVMSKPGIKPELKVRASAIILSNYQSVRELGELVARIEVLEKVRDEQAREQS